MHALTRVLPGAGEWPSVGLAGSQSGSATPGRTQVPSTLGIHSKLTLVGTKHDETRDVGRPLRRCQNALRLTYIKDLYINSTYSEKNGEVTLKYRPPLPHKHGVPLRHHRREGNFHGPAPRSPHKLWGYCSRAERVNTPDERAVDVKRGRSRESSSKSSGTFRERRDMPMTRR